MSVQLNWLASTDEVAVDSYRIKRNGDVIATVQTLGFLDTGLAVNTSYNYEVTAIDEAGNISNPALLAISTLPDLDPPSVPGNVAGTPDVTSVALSWTEPTDNVAVSAYRILRGELDIATVQGLTYLDTGLDPDTSYEYQVIAIDSSDNLSVPASLTVTTLEDFSPPSTPAGFAADPGQTSVLLTWASSTDNVAVDGYRIRRNNSVIATVQGLSFNDTGLDTNTVYNYEIIALDESDNASEPATLTTSTTSDQDPPSIPGNLAGEAGYYSVSLSWTASTDDSPLTGYEVRRNGAVVATVAGLSFADIDLPGGVSLYADLRNLTDERYVSNANAVTDARTAATDVFTPGEGRSAYVGFRVRY
jgi:chitodextrinase